jgi:hypothetical protein
MVIVTPIVMAAQVELRVPMKLALLGQGVKAGLKREILVTAIVLAMTYAISESRDIAAPAEKVWGLVSDLPGLGEYSPENAGGEWCNGATGPSVGAIFTGRNKNGLRRWKTSATVVECEVGKVFEIAISSGPMPVSSWRYEFKDTDGGCQVTESWDDRRATWMRIVTRPLGSHDAAHAKGEMAATLANLARAVVGASR